MRTPKVRSAGGRALLDGCPGGVLPLTSISYTQEKITQKGRDSASANDPGDVWHTRLRHRFSIPSGTAGLNLRNTDCYAGENCDPLQDRLKALVMIGHLVQLFPLLLQGLRRRTHIE